jgi:hypothetical protein
MVWKTRASKIGVVLAMVVAVAAGFVGVADAVPDAGGPSRVVRVKLTFDCRTLTPEALTYAFEHGYCKPTAHGAGGGGLATGFCGDSWIHILPGSGAKGSRRGWAQLDYGVTSRLGRIAGFTLFVNWNSETGRHGSWTDLRLSYGENLYDNRSPIGAGTGRVSAVLDGAVVLWWGARCVVKEPRATVYVA